MTPLLGFHIVLAVALAMILKGNKVMAIIGTWVANPLTIPFILIAEMKIGRWFIGGSPAKLPQLSSSPGEIIQASWNILLPLAIGSLLLGLVAALLTHLLAAPLAEMFQQRFRKHRSAL